MEQVKLLSTTVLLTALIWASADSLVNEAVTVTATFELVPETGASDMLLDVPASDEPFELQISGPRRIVENVDSPLQVRLPVPRRRTGPTVFRLDCGTLKRVLAQQRDDFGKLTVVSVTPDSIPLAVDHWVERDASLVMRRLALAYDVEPQLAPSSVIVRFRESLAAELPQGQPLQIDIAADLERLLRDHPPGSSATKAIPVRLDPRMFGEDAEAIPATVEVTATVQAQRSTEEIPTVPILVAMSFDNLERPLRAVTRDGSSLSLVTQTIKVTGPTDAVGRLVRGTTRAYGIIQLKEEDVENPDVTKLMTPEYRLPPGVELAEPPAPIEFKLTVLSGAEEQP
jgi:hypothetical protein